MPDTYKTFLGDIIVGQIVEYLLQHTVGQVKKQHGEQTGQYQTVAPTGSVQLKMDNRRESNAFSLNQ